MPYFPIFTNLENRTCLMIGRGPLVDDKQAAVERLGARVKRADKFCADDARDAFLIIADVEPREAEVIQAFALKNNILLNVVDKPKYCSFIIPAFVHRGELTVAISSAGKSPSLAARIKREIEARYGPEYGDLLAVLGETRDEVKQALPTYQERKEFYEVLLDLDLIGHLEHEGIEALRTMVRRQLTTFEEGL